MNLFIDASNLRRGGGVTHLEEVLKTRAYEEYGIKQITIWAPEKTLDRIGDLPRLERRSHRLIDAGRWQGVQFRKRHLDKLVDAGTDLLWAPGGTYLGRFRPYVTMLRNFLPFDKPERDRFKYSRDWVRLMYLRRAQAKSFEPADGLIHISQKAHDVLNGLLDLRNVRQTVIHHGLSERFLMAPRKQAPFEAFTPERPVRLLYVSHINHYKHQDKLVEAVARVRAKGIPVELNLVGPALPRAKPKFDAACARFDPEKIWVRWHGEVPYAEVQRFYHEADVCAFMSTCETFGNILLEGMASGLPTLTSNRGALPEVAGGACEEVDPENIAAAAAGLERLIRDCDLRERRARAAYERAKTFTWDRCANATFEFLREARG